MCTEDEKSMRRPKYDRIQYKYEIVVIHVCTFFKNSISSVVRKNSYTGVSSTRVPKSTHEQTSLDFVDGVFIQG